MQKYDKVNCFQTVEQNLKEIRIQALAVVVRELDCPTHLGSKALHLNTDALNKAIEMNKIASKIYILTSESFMHPSYLYQPMVSIPTVVMTPPKQPNRSSSTTSAPALRAPSAADNPLGPAPTTRTSH